MKEKEIKKIVKDKYKKIATDSDNCCSCKSKSNEELAISVGYSKNEIDSFSEANLGLGCGNPIAHANIKKGNIVLDLGSGAGFDSFLASKKVGKTGKVIGVDMTKDMVKKAQKIAKDHNIKNVEFKLGEIDNLPIENNSIDIIISNCVINLAPDKLKVFSEAYRVLKNDGKMYLSDIVLLEKLTSEQKNDPELLAGCVAGAILRESYIDMIKKVGFKVKILHEDKKISKSQYKGINLESLKVEALK